MTRRISALLVVAIAAFGAQGATASANVYYVNGATGSDTNTCLQPAVGVPPLGPCDSIGQALGLAQTNPGPDEVAAAGGTYAETVTVAAGTLLRSSGEGGDPTIDNSPTGAPAVTISGGGAVNDVEIASAHLPVQISGPATLSSSDLVTTTAPSPNASTIFVGAVTGPVTINSNSIIDDGLSAQTAIFSTATSATQLTIQSNTIDGFSAGIWLQNGDSSPLIANNFFQGIHDNNGAGVLVYEGSPEIRRNTFNFPGTGTSSAINLSDTVGPAGAALSRNTIEGMPNGLMVTNTSLPVTLDGDVIAGSGFRGIQSVDIDGGRGDVSATNVTVYDNLDADIGLQDTHLTLDSSIVDDLTELGASTCTISFSRGFAVGGPPADNCDDFQTTADPMFVSPASPDFDYHLQAGSSMIDAGNPLAPAAGVFDLDGDARALSPAPTCPARRDIGADEFVPASPGPAVCPAAATPPALPATTKKCKKGRKLKKGKCVKKKRKKRK